MTTGDMRDVEKYLNEMLDVSTQSKLGMLPQEVERKLKGIERKSYREDFFENMCCNLKTCRYNNGGKCNNEDKRKECIEVSRRVLCMEE